MSITISGFEIEYSTLIISPPHNRHAPKSVQRYCFTPLMYFNLMNQKRFLFHLLNTGTLFTYQSQLKCRHSKENTLNFHCAD